MVADALSRSPWNGNQETTQKSTYQQEIVSETNDIEEMPECTFPINLWLIQRYQLSEPSLMHTYRMVRTIRALFVGVLIDILAL